MAHWHFMVHTRKMAIINRLYFVEEVGDNHYTFRYGGHVFALQCHQKKWSLLRNGCATPLEGDNLHDALYHVIRRFQAE